MSAAAESKVNSSSFGRNEVLCLQVGFTTNGKILALEVDMYLNAGASTDQTIGVSKRYCFSCFSQVVE